MLVCEALTFSLFENYETILDISYNYEVGLLKMILALGVEMKRKVKQLDFVSAFIQGKVRSWIFVYIEDESGYDLPRIKMYIGRPLQLERAIYGLATSGRYFMKSWMNTYRA